jgi:hypothetical protein
MSDKIGSAENMLNEELVKLVLNLARDDQPKPIDASTQIPKIASQEEDLVYEFIQDENNLRVMVNGQVVGQICIYKKDKEAVERCKQRILSGFKMRDQYYEFKEQTIERVRNLIPFLFKKDKKSQEQECTDANSVPYAKS